MKCKHANSMFLSLPTNEYLCLRMRKCKSSELETLGEKTTNQVRRKLVGIPTDIYLRIKSLVYVYPSSGK